MTDTFTTAPADQPSKGRERRSVHRPMRWKPSEVQAVEALATSHGAEFSEFVRAAALGQKPKRNAPAIGDREALIQLLGELNKTGSNLNQLAKRRNMGNHIEEAATVRALQAVEDCADAIRRRLSPSVI